MQRKGDWTVSVGEEVDESGCKYRDLDTIDFVVQSA